MQWENHIWCTLRDGSLSADTSKQSETRWVYDVIKTDQSTWSLKVNEVILVKVISHQSVIIWQFNSTTEFVRIRLRSKGNLRSVGSALRGISSHSQKAMLGYMWVGTTPRVPRNLKNLDTCLPHYLRRVSSNETFWHISSKITGLQWTHHTENSSLFGEKSELITVNSSQRL